MSTAVRRASLRLLPAPLERPAPDPEVVAGDALLTLAELCAGAGCQVEGETLEGLVRRLRSQRLPVLASTEARDALESAMRAYRVRGTGFALNRAWASELVVGVLLSAVKRDEDLPRAETYLAEAKRVASWG